MTEPAIKPPDTPPHPEWDRAFPVWVCRSRSDPKDVRAVGLSQAECVNNFLVSIGGQRWYYSTSYQLSKRNLHIARGVAIARKEWPRNHQGFWCLEMDLYDAVATEDDIIGVGNSWQATVQSAATNGKIDPRKPKPAAMFPWPMEIIA